MMWELDPEGGSAFAVHEGYDLAALQDGDHWVWMVYRAYDDGGDEDTIGEGRAASRLAAVAQAEAAAIRAAEEDRKIALDLGGDAEEGAASAATSASAQR